MAAMSRATRRIVVAHLTSRGMSPADIASELDVSRDTVRRDLDAVRDGAPAAAEPAAAPDAPPDAPGLRLPEDTQLRQDLNILAAAHRAPAEDVARALIHQAAQDVRHRWTARLTAHRPVRQA